MKIYRQLKHFVTRLFWLSPMMGGLLPTAKFLIKVKGKPFAFGKILYQNMVVQFRNCDSTALKEVFVDQEYKFLSPILSEQKKPVLVDVGAHIGTFSLWCFQQNPMIQIYSIEANPESYKILTKNLEKNIPFDSFSTINKAAWDSDSFLKIKTDGDSMGNKVSKEGTVEVQGIDFKDLVDPILTKYKKIDIMKIDIEGAEESFLQKSDNYFSRIERIVIELHPDYCDTNFVQKKLSNFYKNIININGREDSKPLLFCYN